MRVLIIEDDTEIAEMMRYGLEGAGYAVDHAADGAKGLTMAGDISYGLIVLDVMLPGVDGWGVCKSLRLQRNSVPILMLSARDSIEDRVRGLDTGADDYLPKPFAFPEFLARVRSLMRRDRLHKSRVIRLGDLEVDIAQRTVTRGGEEIGLSRREFDLLEALASQEGRVLTREAIQERVWMNAEAVQGTVDVYIGSLRKKLDAGHKHKLIHTVHGVGYKLLAPDDESES